MSYEIFYYFKYGVFAINNMSWKSTCTCCGVFMLHVRVFMLHICTCVYVAYVSLCSCYIHVPVFMLYKCICFTFMQPSECI